MIRKGARLNFAMGASLHRYATGWSTFSELKKEYELKKIDLDDYVDEFDSRHNKRRIK